MTLIVNINSDDNALPSSDLQRIGRALRSLSDLQSQGSVVPTGTVQCIDLSYSGAGANDVETIARNMSISKVAKIPAGGWRHTQLLSAKTPAELIADGVQVKFVFESKNEMFIVVRDDNALEYGEFSGDVENTSGVGNVPIKQSPPMNEAAYQVRTEEVREKCNELLDRLVGQLSGSAQAEVNAVRDGVLETIVPVLDPSSQQSVFIEQLGAYSVRQCS